MIQQGDGTWARWLEMGYCPTCRAVLNPETESNGRIDRSCPACNLIIIEPKRDENDGS